MYYKLNFSKGESSNTIEVSFLRGLPVWRIAGADFLNNHIKTRISALCKVLKVNLPRKTLFISFQKKISYQQYLDLEFYVIWIILYLCGFTRVEPSVLISEVRVSLDANCQLGSKTQTVFQLIKQKDYYTHSFTQTQSLMQKFIQKLAQNKLSVLSVGPIGQGKTFDLIAVCKSLNQECYQINEASSLSTIRSFCNRGDPQKLFLVDDLGMFSKAKLNLLKHLGDQTVYPNHVLLATANPCPCGNYMSQQLICSCNTRRVQAYYNKIGKALLDRFSAIVYQDSFLEKSLNKLKPLILTDSSGYTAQDASLQVMLNHYIWQKSYTNRKTKQVRAISQAFYRLESQSLIMDLVGVCNDFYNRLYAVN